MSHAFPLCPYCNGPVSSKGTYGMVHDECVIREKNRITEQVERSRKGLGPVPNRRERRMLERQRTKRPRKP